MGPIALPACDKKSTLEKRSGAVAAKKNWATRRSEDLSVKSSIILKMKVTKTSPKVITSKKFHLS